MSSSKCMFCGYNATLRLMVEVFGHPGVIYFCDMCQEKGKIAGRGFRIVRSGTGKSHQRRTSGHLHKKQPKSMREQ